VSVTLLVSSLGAGPGVALAQQPSALQATLVSATPSSATPQVVDGQVDAVAVVGNTVLIGGTFTGIQPPGGGTTTAQSYLAAFDRTTGAIDTSFRPTLNGLVDSIGVLSSTAVVVGGQFGTVNTRSERGIAAIRVADGSLLPGFSAQTNLHLTSVGHVNAVVVRAGRLFVGGRFQNVNGVPRNGLAELSPVTGAVVAALNLPLGMPRSGSPVPWVGTLDVSPNGRTMVVGGNFGTIGGLPRRQLAVVDTASRSVTPWATLSFAPACSPTDNTYVRMVSFSPDGTYFVVGTGGGPRAGTLCDSASRWEAKGGGANQSPTWVDFTGGDTIESAVTTGTAVYVGGHQRWMNNFSGSNSAGPGAYQLGSDTGKGDLAALDPASGMPLPWGATLSPRAGGADALLAIPSGVWVGSDTTTTVGAHQRIAFFPVAGGEPVPASPNHFLPGPVYVSGPGASLVSRSYDTVGFGNAAAVADPGTVPWASVHGAFLYDGTLFFAVNGDINLWQASFDGSTVGPPSVVPGNWFDFSAVKTMTYDSGRLYYTTGDGKLYDRWFTGATPMVGSQLNTAAATGYAGVTSMFITDGTLYVQAGGKLYRRAMDGAAPVGASVQVSGPGLDSIGWDATSTFVPAAAAGVVSGPVDIVARDSLGRLLLYRGNGKGKLPARRVIGTGWRTFTAILGPRDLDGDGHVDIVGRDSQGRLWLYPGNGVGGLSPRRLIGIDWNVMSAIVGPGDFDGNGTADVLARDRAGRLWLYPGDGTGRLTARRLVGTGWNSMSAIIGPGDFSGDGHADVIARDRLGALWLYRGNGVGRFTSRVLVGHSWNSMTAVVGPGDVNSDAHVDVVSRDTAGRLWLYPGNGSGGWRGRVQMGVGWRSMTAIVGPGDFG
jgi:hypothetical protein